MTPRDFERVRGLFLAATELAPHARGAFLDAHCAEEPSLRTAVEALLAAEGAGEQMLDVPERVREMRSAMEDALRTWEALPMPQWIGRYRVLETLGRGGMGIVYLAEQENPRRKVAVKVVQPGSMSPSTSRRFQHEASILGQLTHPGIAQIYEAGVATVQLPEGGTARWPFLAMEYVRGQPLTAYAQAHCPDTRSRVLLLAAVCDAIQHAHQKSVVHRDLKPGNILVTADGQVKVLDFGVARLTNSDVQTVTMQTEAGNVVGTLPYMRLSQNRDTC